MTANPPYPAHSGVGKFALLLMALAIAAGAVAFISSGMAHAVERHGNEPMIVRDCLDKHGVKQLWFNPETNRHAEMCQYGDTKFGLRISANNLKDDVTFFVMRKMTRIEQVMKYLLNRGYVCISGC